MKSISSLLLIVGFCTSAANGFTSIVLDPRLRLPQLTRRISISTSPLPPMTRPSSCFLASSSNDDVEEAKFEHTLAILAMPATSVDRIVNDAILVAAVASSSKLSVVLRCEGLDPPTVASLRRYVGEVYSQLWDCVMEQSEDLVDLDVVVYPQNLPNAAPESWIDIQPDLDCVCSHDALCGWVSSAATGRGTRFQDSRGIGGVEAHVAALNRERQSRGLNPVSALPVQLSGPVLENPSETVVFLEDDDGAKSNIEYQMHRRDDDSADDYFANEDVNLLSGARASRERSQLFDSVTVGGTFDGLHFGHRKLLTLAVSSVTPVTGKLLVGVTTDAMLTRKAYSEYIPDLEERMEDVRNFLHRLAPGMMNRVKLVPIEDAFGPPGQPNTHFDALVLSHETLETGHLLNEHRLSLGLKPLALLCTLRTEQHGMSSTALRRRRFHQKERTKENLRK